MRCLLVIALERLNRSAAPTKMPDSTTCRKTFMLSRVETRHDGHGQGAGHALCNRASALRVRKYSTSNRLRKAISQPFIVALMTDLLDIKADDSVLEIGTGLGYQAAILAQLAARYTPLK